MPLVEFHLRLRHSTTRCATAAKQYNMLQQEAVDMMYFLLRHEGVFVGPSAALNVAGAVRVAKTLPPGSTVVTILCDHGDRYWSKGYSEKWLEVYTMYSAQPPMLVYSNGMCCVSCCS